MCDKVRCKLNIFIIIIFILIDIILDNYYGGQQPSDAVLWASDLNADGDIDISLIPTSVQAWYEKQNQISDDEDENSDVEWE